MGAVKRFSWREGARWKMAVFLAMSAAYLANFICEFNDGIGGPSGSASVVLAASMTWLTLLCTLAVSVNWSLHVQHYNTWQHQHGTFRIEARTRRSRAEGLA